MGIKVYEKGLCSFNISKESGNLHVKDKKDGNHRPIKYAAYYDHEEPLDLRCYMNITDKSITEAVQDLTQEGIVLVGHRFNISFYDEDAVRVFLKTMGAEEKETKKV